MAKKRSKISEYNEDVRIENKALVREIEQNYVDNELNGLDNAIAAKREEIEKRIWEYQCRFGSADENLKPAANPMIIQKYFFQSINPLVNVEPFYSAEKLGIVWQLYEEMIGRINAEIGVVVPNISNFCAFAGLRVSTFKSYKNSPDEALRIVVEKIEDGCYDSNVTMAQMGYLKERMTVFRMKSEQEKVEKESPTTIINASEGINITQINARVKELKAFSEKKRQVEVLNEPK